MRKLNNENFAKKYAFEIKKDFEKNPSHTKFRFDIITDILSEQFNERIFENIFCTEIKCKIKIENRENERYIISGELINITFENDSKLILRQFNSKDSGRGATPLSNWDCLNK